MHDPSNGITAPAMCNSPHTRSATITSSSLWMYGGAFGLVPNVAALLGRFGAAAYPTAVATLEVAPSAPSGVITLG